LSGRFSRRDPLGIRKIRDNLLAREYELLVLHKNKILTDEEVKGLKTEIDQFKELVSRLIEIYEQAVEKAENKLARITQTK